jgi:hypothetical protein
MRMNTYEEKAFRELRAWQRRMEKSPSIINRLTKGMQKKTNSFIPEKIHMVVTEAIKNMVKVVLVGSGFITRGPLLDASLEERERQIGEKIQFYKKAAAVSGAGTGAAGFFVGLADFPILLSLKMKFLFDTASIYGFDVKDYRERVYILNVFQLAFSSQERTNEVYTQVLNWNDFVKELPLDVDSFDWRTFQQEYRDYIDLAKLLQLMPGIGAVVGAVANYRLMDKLGETAMNAYRLRLSNMKNS